MLKEEMESIRERAKELLANYEKTKTAIRKEVAKEYARTIRDLQNERAVRENVVKNKMIEIGELKDRIGSLNNRIFGLESKSKLWEHECARISDAYHRMVRSYSNPGLVEVQMQVILEYTDALIRFARGHRWGKDTVDMAIRYRDSIQDKLRELISEIDNNREEDLSLDSARKHVEVGCKNAGRDISSS